MRVLGNVGENRGTCWGTTPMGRRRDGRANHRRGGSSIRRFARRASAPRSSSTGRRAASPRSAASSSCDSADGRRRPRARPAFLVAPAPRRGPGPSRSPVGRFRDPPLGGNRPIVVAKPTSTASTRRDEERTDHSTVDDVVGVFHLVTVGVWVFFLAVTCTRARQPAPRAPGHLLGLAVLLVTAGRRRRAGVVRRSPPTCRTPIIVGAGEVGQLTARKLRAASRVRHRTSSGSSTRSRRSAATISAT